MAVQQDGIDVSFPAAGDLSADQFKLMVIEDDGQVNRGVGDGSAFIGILQNKPAAANRGATVRISGISKCTPTDAINERDRLTATANGFANATTTATHHVAALAVTASAGSAQLCEVVVVPGLFGA